MIGCAQLIDTSNKFSASDKTHALALGARTDPTVDLPIAGGSGRAIVVFRNDDPSAMSEVEHEKRVAKVFEKYCVPQVLGVIPNCCEEGFREIRGTRNRPLASNPAMVDFLRQYAASSGSEIALHGYTHRTNRLSIPARREFFEFRDVGLAEQLAWMKAGTEMIESTLGVRPTTFIPPWNRLDADTLVACEQCGYKIVSAGTWTPTRPGLLSLGTDCDLADFPLRLEVALRSGNTVLIRVLFHSLTTRSEVELRTLETAVRAAATTKGCEVTTLDHIARRYSDQARKVNEAASLIIDPTERVGTPAARAELYYRAARKIMRQPGEVRGFLRELHDSGRVDQLSSLQSMAAGSAVRTLFLGRMICVFVAAQISGLILAVTRGMDLPMRGIVLGLFGVALVLAGLVASRTATAPDTRREILLAMFLSLLGMAIPLAYSGLMTGRVI